MRFYCVWEKKLRLNRDLVILEKEFWFDYEKKVVI